MAYKKDVERNPVGKPRKFKSPAEMQKKIDEYFKIMQPEIMKHPNGKPMINPKTNVPLIKQNPPTLTGLVLHLGFACRQSLYEYENNFPEYTDTIKKARTRCENYAESGGMSGDVPPAMAIFALKNYGWTDKQEIDLKSKQEIIYLDSQDEKL